MCVAGMQLSGEGNQHYRAFEMAELLLLSSRFLETQYTKHWFVFNGHDK
jgi:hypothetical protein